MSLNHHLPKKIELKPKRHHFFTFFIFLCGILLPPIDFPSHGHNFYIQNIRNNENRARTPKWAIKAGLVDPSDKERRDRKSQWKKRFDERNNQSSHVGAALEEGEVGENYIPEDPREIERRERLRSEGLWTGQDEEYYNEDAAPNQRKWHYPANFEGTVGDGRSAARRQDSTGGDRWERSRDSRDSEDGERDPITGAIIGGGRSNGNGYGNYPSAGATDEDGPEWGRDYGSKKKKGSKNPLKKNKQNTSTVGNWIDDGPMSASAGAGKTGGGGKSGSGAGSGAYGRGGYDDLGNTGSGGYGRSGGANGGAGGGGGGGGGQAKKQSNDPFDHEF